MNLDKFIFMKNEVGLCYDPIQHTWYCPVYHNDINAHVFKPIAHTDIERWSMAELRLLFHIDRV